MSMSGEVQALAVVAGDGPDQSLRLARAFDRFTLGLLGIVLALAANPFLALLPSPHARYLYLLPTWYAALASLHLGAADLPGREWAATVWWLRWSALALAGLAPFWGWWQAALESRYCLFNVGLFALALFLFLYHLMGVARLLALARGQDWLAQLARLARMAAVYLLMAPTLALFLVAWYGNNSGHDIVTLLDRLSPWKRHLLMSPMLLAIVVSWQMCRLHPLSGQPRKDPP